jgi:hypothetical protein
MTRFLQMFFLSIALMPAGLCIPDDGAPSQENPGQKTIDTLIRLGIPLHRDTGGSVRWIEARRGELTDEALRFLCNLNNLEWLEIGGGAVTASGLENLRYCSALKRLYIHDINLRGYELPWLSYLIRLEALSLQRTGIDGRVLGNIRAQESLRVLNLTKNNIRDEDMDRIAEFEGLEVLALSDTRITGAGLAKLKNMSRLNALNLTRTAVRDEDLTLFLSMPNLRIAYMYGCGVSDAVVGNMRAQAMLLAIFR